jgi:hypothetical protein
MGDRLYLSRSSFAVGMADDDNVERKLASGRTEGCDDSNLKVTAPRRLLLLLAFPFLTQRRISRSRVKQLHDHLKLLMTIGLYKRRIMMMVMMKLGSVELESS